MISRTKALKITCNVPEGVAALAGTAAGIFGSVQDLVSKPELLSLYGSLVRIVDF